MQASIYKGILSQYRLFQPVSQIIHLCMKFDISKDYEGAMAVGLLGMDTVILMVLLIADSCMSEYHKKKGLLIMTVVL